MPRVAVYLAIPQQILQKRGLPCPEETADEGNRDAVVNHLGPLTRFFGGFSFLCRTYNLRKQNFQIQKNRGVPVSTVLVWLGPVDLLMPCPAGLSGPFSCKGLGPQNDYPVGFAHYYIGWGAYRKKPSKRKDSHRCAARWSVSTPERGRHRSRALSENYDHPCDNCANIKKRR